MTGKEELTGNQDCFVTRKDCKNKFLSCRSCSFCKWVSAKERCKSQLLLSVSRNKACERCFLCISVKFCPNCCTKSTRKGQITPVLEEMGSPRHQPQSTNIPQRRLHSPLLVLAQLDQVTNKNKLLCKSLQEPLPV